MKQWIRQSHSSCELSNKFSDFPLKKVLKLLHIYTNSISPYYSAKIFYYYTEYYEISFNKIFSFIKTNRLKYRHPATWCQILNAFVESCTNIRRNPIHTKMNKRVAEVVHSSHFKEIIFHFINLQVTYKLKLMICKTMLKICTKNQM